MSAAPSTVEAGATVTFTGSLAPAAAGQMVDPEGENPGGVGFHLIVAAPVNAVGEYSIPYTFYAAGSHITRIKARGERAEPGWRERAVYNACGRPVGHQMAARRPAKASWPPRLASARTSAARAS